MKNRLTFTALSIAALLATVARSGHELPVYPSFYPHEIEIRDARAGAGGRALLEAEVHAYLGPPPRFAGPPPESIRTVESLGAFVVVRINPHRHWPRTNLRPAPWPSAWSRDLAGKPGEFIFHPYPVTPFHGDYLHHADLAEAAKARFSDVAARRLLPSAS